MKSLVVAFALMALAFAAPLPAAAQTSPDEMVEGNIAGQILLAEREDASRGTCKTVYAYRYLKNPLYGFYYWKYFEQVKWCWKNGAISFTKRWRWVECCHVGTGWDFYGHIGSNLQGGVGKDEFYAWTQGKFKQCLPYVLCTNVKTPWVALRVHAGGGWQYATGT